MEQVTIEANDLIAPIVLVQDIAVPLNASGNAVINALMIDAGSSDNCGIANISLDETLFDCSQLGQQTVTLTVTDNAGNIASANAMVVVLDEIAPVITCPTSFSSNSCGEITYNAPTATDNCDDLQINLVDGLPSGSVFPSGENTITYEVIDAAGNSATCSFTIIAKTDLVAEAVSTATTCFGASDGVISTQVNGGTPNYEYLWDNGQTTPTAVDLAAGEYTVTITDNTGCTTVISETVVEPSPVELLEYTVTNESNGNADGAINITVDGGTPPYSFSWILNGREVSTEEDPVGLATGEYRVNITDANDCYLSSELIYVDNVVGVNNPEIASKLHVRPNPSNGWLEIDPDHYFAMPLQVKLYDVAGRHLLSQTLGTERRLDISAYANGVYLLKVVIEDEVVVRKIVLERG